MTQKETRGVVKIHRHRNLLPRRTRPASFLIRLTATPGKQAIGFFNKNLVSEYPHERAVADGVNVGYDVYRIKSQVTEQGRKIEKGLFVDRREKETRKLRWEQLDDDLTFAAKELDRSIVVKDQIRTVLQAFRRSTVRPLDAFGADHAA